MAIAASNEWKITVNAAAQGLAINPLSSFGAFVHWLVYFETNIELKMVYSM